GARRATGDAGGATRGTGDISGAHRATGEVGGANGGETAEERLRRRSTPLVRKMAAEHNLDLSAIAGSGLAGRVTKNDILSYLEAGPAAASAPAPAAAPVAAPRAAPAAPVHAPSVEAWPGDRVEPWSRIRKLT